MYVVYINLLYFLSIFLFTYNKNLLSQKNHVIHSQMLFLGQGIRLLQFFLSLMPLILFQLKQLWQFDKELHFEVPFNKRNLEI